MADTPTTVAATEPWAFTQNPPLDSHFGMPRETERRGHKADSHTLRQLWRIGLLPPFVEVRSRRDPRAVSPEPLDDLRTTEPTWAHSQHAVVRSAAASNRLVDPLELGFRRHLRFDPEAGESRAGWHNGLIYSHWQLLEVYELRSLVDELGSSPRGGRAMPRRSTQWNVASFEKTRRRSALLTGIEARYLPEVLPNSVYLQSSHAEDWHQYREAYDPVAALTRLGWAPEELPDVAWRLLHSADRVDPHTGPLRDLLRRLPRARWKDIRGDALVSLDFRVGAELVLRCIEDIDSLIGTKFAEDRYIEGHRRLSYRSNTLDNDLGRLGLSPHPKVLMIVEGETEEYLVPLVRDQINVPRDLQALRVLTLRGKDRDITKVAALAAAPLIERVERDGTLRLARPPTHILVVLDPDAGLTTPDLVEKARTRIVHELDLVVKAQGHQADWDSLSYLVHFHTWEGGTFEFAHFSDEELCEAIVHLDPRRDRATTLRVLAVLRADGADIKKALKSRGLEISKTSLAEQLWPVLQASIASVMGGSSDKAPQIAERIEQAYWIGAQVSPGSWSIAPRS